MTEVCGVQERWPHLQRLRELHHVVVGHIGHVLHKRFNRHFKVSLSQLYNSWHFEKRRDFSPASPLPVALSPLRLVRRTCSDYNQVQLVAHQAARSSIVLFNNSWPSGSGQSLTTGVNLAGGIAHHYAVQPGEGHHQGPHRVKQR